MRSIGHQVLVVGLLLLVPHFLAGGGKKPFQENPREFYLGEGWAELEPDAGTAREQAKTRALGDLARNVRVAVRSTILDVLGQNAGRPQESLESRIDTYANIPPTQLDREEFQLHHPRRGQVRCRVAVRRARYDGDVHRDLMAKKNRALAEAQRAHSALEEGRLAEALHAFALLQSRAETDFPGLPLEGVVDQNGKIVDVLAWARDHRDKILGSLRLECSSDPFIYDRNGRYAGPVTAQLIWTGTGPVHLEGIPLRSRWKHRPQQALLAVESDENGVGRFHPVVDLFVAHSTLEIEVEGHDGPPSPACQSLFHQRREVILNVQSNRNEVQSAFTDFVEDQLRRLPWDVRTESSGGSPPPGEESLIAIEIQTTLTRHPDGEIHRSVLNSRVQIFSGPKGKWVFRGEGPSAEGYGATPTDAVKKALHALMGNWSDWMDNQVKGLP